MCNNFYVEPNDFEMHSVTELAALLSQTVTESAATQSQRIAAIQWALRSQSSYGAYNLTVYGTWTDTSCEYDLPCCGANIVSVQYRASDCADCYTDIDFSVRHGKLRVLVPCHTSYRMAMQARNQFTDEQRTINMAKLSSDGCEYEIYLEGQPDIPSYGIVRICGEAWVYRCKRGFSWQEQGVGIGEYTWGIDSEVGMLSTDTIPLPDMSDHGWLQPKGKHTVLYAQRLGNCGTLKIADVLTELPGVLVEFPVILSDGTQVNRIIATAAAHLYRLLINGCTSPNDLSRYTGMQKHWAEEAIRMQQHATRSVRTRLVRNNGFKSELPPRDRRPTSRAWPYRRVNCCWQ